MGKSSFLPKRLSTIYFAAVLLLGLACAPAAKAACSFMSVSAAGFAGIGNPDSGEAYGYVLPGGGNGTFTLTFSAPGCAWSLYDDGATVTAGIAISPSFSGTNTGTSLVLSVTVPSYSPGRTAQWFIEVAGQTVGTVNIQQNASSCTASFSSPSTSVSSSGGSGTFPINVPYGCWISYSFSPSGETWLTGSNDGAYPMTGAPLYILLNLLYAAAANTTGSARSAALNITQPSAVSFTVNQAAGSGPSAPTLIATPPSITVTSVVGGPSVTQTVSFTSSNSTPVNITNVTDSSSAFWDFGSWSPGPTPSSMPIQFSTAGLSVGTYHDTFTVTSNASNSTLQIPITYNIVASGGGGGGSGSPSLGVSPSGPINAIGVPNANSNSNQPQPLANYCASGSPGCPPIAITTSDSSQPISFSVTTHTSNAVGPNWLLASLDSGSTFHTSLTGNTGASGASLALYSNFTGFVPGNYSASFTITPTSNSTSSPVTIQVNVQVNGEGGLNVSFAPQATTTTMPLTDAPQGRTGAIIVNAANSNTPMLFGLAATVSTPPGGNWLQVNSSSQQTNATASVTALTTGLSNGVYQGTVKVMDSAGISEFTITVNLTISSAVPAGTLIASPPAITINTTVNGATSITNVSLTSGSPSAPITITNEAEYNPATTWDFIQGSPTVTPTSISVSINPAGLAVGSYSDGITVTSNASNSPLNIPIVLNVMPPATSHTYYFSELTFAGGFQTTLTYINYGGSAVTCTTNFWGNDGNPLIVPFSDGATASRTDVLSPGSSIHVQTNASLSGLPIEGWAQAACTGAVQASLLYRLYQNGAPVGETSVNAETAPTTKFVTFAQAAAASTGVAYANPSATQSATVTITAYNAAGVQLGSQNVALGPMQHGSKNVNAIPNAQNFTGSVVITSTNPIISLSLNAEAFPVFSSLPPGDLRSPVPSGSQTYYFSELTFGFGFQTTLTYINYGSSPVTCSTHFWSDGGAPLIVPFADGTSASRTDVLPPNGSIHVQTIANLADAVSAGWAQASCTGPVQSGLLYRFSQGGTPAGEASVNAEIAATTSFVTFAQAANGNSTGVAYGNPSSTQTATITITGYDAAGAPISSHTITLNPMTHGAVNVGPLFGVPTFTGSIAISSNVPIISLSLNAEVFPVFSSLPPGDL